MGPEQFQRQVRLNASAQLVWDVVGRFDDIGVWYPGVVKVASNGKPPQTGERTRYITSIDGTHFEEVLLHHNDTKRQLVYWLREGDLAVETYCAYLHVAAVDEHACLFRWTVIYTSGNDGLSSASDVREVVEDGIRALAERFGGNEP